ncbi:hypothetical protein BHM03_00013026 [Ensete ventricosum]|nr:hypothetical protein BHM03_00013026 [Ensete ventricosum]
MVGRHLLVRPKALMVGTVRPKERKSTCGRCGLALVMGSFKRLNPIGRVARVPQMAGAAPPNPLGPVPPQANRKPHLVRVPSSDHLYVHQQRDPLSGEHVSVSVAGAPGSCVDGSLRDICSGSASFCFPSTLRGFGSLKEDSCKEPGFDAREGCASSEWRSGSVAAFKMASGGAVSCRLVDTVGGIDGELSSGGKNSGGDAAASCMAPLVPDVSIRMLSMMTAGLDDHDKDIYSGLLNGSSSAIVEISPPFLDWGENSLYTPSMAFLTVKSAYKNGVLDVYGPFSTDPQYYAYNFEKLQLAPGESASIAFIFLPRWVGSSSAHLVLQTSLGGFIIQARGVAIESPYKIEPLVGISIPSSKSLIRNLSIYNPFDDVLHVEEVSAWVSLAGQTDQSVHVVCQTDALQQSSTELGYFLTDNKLFRVENSKLVLRWLDIRPQKQWDLSAHKTEPILEMRLSSSEDENRKAELVNEYHICHNIALDSPKKTEEKQGFIHQKDITFSPQTVTAKPAEVFDNYNMLEAPQSGGLTIRVVKEKGRRRKKRTIGSRFAAKLEVSSSQSGNSTPSSPLSPSASTPKQAWPLSPKSGITTFAGVSSEEKQQKKHDAVDATGIRVSETEEHRRQSPVTAKSAGNQTTSPSSVNSSGSVWFAHSAAAPSVLATNSPIAPSARAPGPKSSKDKAIKMEENDGVEKEFTYDIWGHHFADSFLVRQKEFTSNMVDASEGVEDE